MIKHKNLKINRLECSPDRRWVDEVKERNGEQPEFNKNPNFENFSFETTKKKLSEKINEEEICVRSEELKLRLKEDLRNLKNIEFLEKTKTRAEIALSELRRQKNEKEAYVRTKLIFRKKIGKR